jgi:[acyl-carrier-protein] S-malonyltransferase
MSVKKTAVLFPGQGAHECSMLEGVANGNLFAERYEKVRRTLQCNPMEEFSKGNRNYVNRNKVSSLLTLLVSSLSLDMYLDVEDELPVFYAGYSVGQWTALYAAGCISFDALIDIAAARADCMDDCMKERQGVMMAVIGVREEALEEYLDAIRKQGHFIVISNYNCLGQYSISGTKEAVEIAYANAESLHPRKTAILPVQGAWHCELLKPAETAFAAYLNTISLAPPRIPVVDGMTGDLLPENMEIVKQQMARHISHPVRWGKGIQRLIQAGCEEFVEIGYGNVLTKFGFFIDREKTHRSFYLA